MKVNNGLGEWFRHNLTYLSVCPTLIIKLKGKKIYSDKSII